MSQVQVGSKKCIDIVDRNLSDRMTVCRSINYDEKDPFLCISCGYCKYARFDFSLVCKPCCAVDPIETDEDRKKVLHICISL